MSMTSTSTSTPSPPFNSPTPWVEKYRPKTFDSIVLDETNRTILENIIQGGYFPNLLFYGPPGTGKTTTIINLVTAFQTKYFETQAQTLATTNPAASSIGLGTVIHLNASDERGVDVIRSQISTFVNTKSLFGRGDQLKFVILDEVDYMTKNAQLALRYLINNYNQDAVCNVKFCLICNYVSKIDESLQSEFVKMRFNQLPELHIVQFLQQINAAEKLGLSLDTLCNIQTQFGSDIRGMINFMQSNQSVAACRVIHRTLWNDLLALETAPAIVSMLNRVSRDYGIERRSMVFQFLNYVIRTRQADLTSEFLTRVEHATHNMDCKVDHLVEYVSLVILKWKRDV
jgi:DNA polymerase III delta prime subunit